MPAITFATYGSRDYRTIIALVGDRRGATKPFEDITATVRIGGQCVDLLVPDNVYSRFYKGERRWRTPTDVSKREHAWRERLRNQVFSLAERL